MTTSVKDGKSLSTFGKNVSLIDNQNTNLKMLNQSGLHLNEYGTGGFVNNFASMLRLRKKSSQSLKESNYE